MVAQLIKRGACNLVPWVQAQQFVKLFRRFDMGTIVFLFLFSQVIIYLQKTFLVVHTVLYFVWVKLLLLWFQFGISRYRGRGSKMNEGVEISRYRRRGYKMGKGAKIGRGISIV